jgi:hypothetical protein
MRFGMMNRSLVLELLLLGLSMLESLLGVYTAGNPTLFDGNGPSPLAGGIILLSFEDTSGWGGLLDVFEYFIPCMAAIRTC